MGQSGESACLMHEISSDMAWFLYLRQEIELLREKAGHNLDPEISRPIREHLEKAIDYLNQKLRAENKGE